MLHKKNNNNVLALDAWMKRLDTYADWYLRETDGVDESKRPGKPKTHQDLFGMEGSFRQLTVD
jgi:hypothetical protein